MRQAIVGAVLCLAGCASGPEYERADPVIAGRAYVGEPVPLGPLKAHIEARSDPENPEMLELTLGFRGEGDDKSLVVSGALRYGDRAATLVERHRLKDGTAGCGSEVAAEVGVEYLFNAPLYPDSWTCMTLRFEMPGRQPQDALELLFNPISVGGRLVRPFPIAFAPRVE